MDFLPILYERKRYLHLPGVQEPGPEDHDGFACALLELDLDGVELLVDDLDHSLDFFRRDGPGSTLFAQEVHHVRRELVTRLERKTIT